MQLAYEILHILADAKFHSGTWLSQIFKVGRSTIWKAVNYLKGRGLQINSISGKGYQLVQPMEIISKSAILQHLPVQYHSFFPRLDILNVVNSTNDYLLDRLHQIDSGHVCIALEQTQGKGRSGKQWFSPLGANIYLSFKWQFNNKLHDLSGISLMMALVVLNSLKAYYHFSPEYLGIKWPNDIWYKDQKLCGILIEGSSRSDGAHNLVIGIGLNVQMPKPASIDINSTDLESIFGSVPSKNHLIALLLQHAADYLQLFQAQGLQAFSASWSSFDLLIGRTVQLNVPNHSEIGIASGINERGELLVRSGDILKAIRYGEVSVVPTH